jgi:hypothetical protein
MIGEVSPSLPLNQLATAGVILKVLHYQQFKQNPNIKMCYAVAKEERVDENLRAEWPHNYNA